MQVVETVLEIGSYNVTQKVISSNGKLTGFIISWEDSERGLEVDMKALLGREVAEHSFEISHRVDEIDWSVQIYKHDTIPAGTILVPLLGSERILSELRHYDKIFDEANKQFKVIRDIYEL